MERCSIKHDESMPPSAGLVNLDDLFSTRKFLLDLGPARFHCADQGWLAAVADPQPDHRRRLRAQQRQVGKILVLGDDDAAVLDCVVPDYRVIGPVELHITNVCRRVAFGLKPAHQRGRQMIIDQKIHAVRTTV